MAENNWLLNDSAPASLGQEFSSATTAKAWGWFGLPAAGEGSEFETAATPSTATPWTPAELAFNAAEVGGGAHDITGAGQIAGAEAFGGAVVVVVVAGAGIASAEAEGAPFVVASVVGAGQIAGAEALGTPAVQATIGAAGMPSAEAFGQPLVGDTGISGAGQIASAEALGTPAVQATIGAAAIASAEAFGAPQVGDASITPNDPDIGPPSALRPRHRARRMQLIFDEYDDDLEREEEEALLEVGAF